MPTKIISADSHVTEPADTYLPRIDPKYRDTAPYLAYVENVGDVFTVPGMKVPVPMGLVAGAGKSSDELRPFGVRFDELHRGGWDPQARLADQDRDGVAGEIIYPTVGMAICNHRDIDYKKACMDAYNLWIAEYCSAHPDRLFGIGQTAMRTPQEGIADIQAIKDLGLRGVMMPGNPGVSDYDDLAYDPFWEAAIDSGLPLSFHVLTTRDSSVFGGVSRGPRLNTWVNTMRACQDIMGMLVFSGVFERHPELRIICVEADAGWVPHYVYRMDHAFERHRNWMAPGTTLTRKPSEYFLENIYITFQDDWVAFATAELMNPERLMWANDFPHSDSTWPWSQELLAKHTKGMSDRTRDLMLHDNVTALYGL